MFPESFDRVFRRAVIADVAYCVCADYALKVALRVCWNLHARRVGGGVLGIVNWNIGLCLGGGEKDISGRRLLKNIFEECFCS